MFSDLGFLADWTSHTSGRPQCHRRGQAERRPAPLPELDSLVGERENAVYSSYPREVAEFG